MWSSNRVDLEKELFDEISGSFILILKNIKNILASQMQFWEDLIDLGNQRNSLLMEEAKLDKKFRLNQIRNANEARLEGISPQLAMAGGAGAALALPAPAEDEDGEGGGISALGASGLTLAALAVWKKIKGGMRFIFGLPGKIGFAIKQAGKLIFAKFLSTKAGKPFMKNIGKIRAWPIILAAMVANSFYSGIKSAFADDQTGGNPQSDNADAEDQSMLDKVLDNNVFIVDIVSTIINSSLFNDSKSNTIFDLLFKNFFINLFTKCRK